MLVIEPTSGLCSRLYTLADAYMLAQKYNTNLVIIWNVTSDCNCCYRDIFSKEQFSNIKVKIFEFKKFNYHIKNMDINFKNIFKICYELMNRMIENLRYVILKVLLKIRCYKYIDYYKNEKFNEYDILTNKSVYLSAFCGIGNHGDVNTIKIAEKLMRKSSDIIDNKDYVGVHIRRTDHEPAKKYSSTEKFILEMNNILEKNPNTKFFLATDDWDEEKKLKEIFGDKIVTQKEKTLNRDSKEGMESSIIDFLCLSKTKYILGSYTSVFSKFSSDYGKIDLKIV